MKKKIVNITFNTTENKGMCRLAAGTSANNWRYWNIKYKLSVSRNLRRRRNIACPRKRWEAEDGAGKFFSVCNM